MQRFSQKCFIKAVIFILIEDKEKNIQPHQYSVFVVPESLRMHNAKRFSDDLFVPRYDSFSMNPEKMTIIP